MKSYFNKSKSNANSEVKSLESVTFFDGQSSIEKKIERRSEQTILELAIESGISISHSCGGNGSCGTCLIRLRNFAGELPSRGGLEQEMASDRDFEDDERLSCQVIVQAGMTIEYTKDPL